ncbi:MAG: TonB-dependent receptor domain-containing protein [Thiotrichales bacterium]
MFTSFMSRPRLTAISCATALAVSFPIIAAETTTLTPVQVTANRHAQSSDEILAPVLVLTRDDIERSTALDVPGLLRGQPGLHVATSGGLGKQTSVFMRGANSNHVLILVDGVRYGSATAGAVSWEHLPLALIERIEIVRGPRSSVYGSEAIAGVIQIFTRASVTEPGLDAAIEVGSNDTRQLTAGITQRHGDSSYSVRASTLRSAGIDAYEGVEPDRDGYRNDAFNAGFQFAPTTRSTVGATLLHAKGRTEFDDTFGSSANSETRFVEQSAQMTWDLAATRQWSFQARIGGSRDELDSEANGADTYKSHSDVNEFGAHARYRGRNGLEVLAGADLRHDRVEYRDAFGGDSETFARRSRDNGGVFLTGGSPFASGGLAQASLRFDDNDAYGEHTSGNLELGWELRPATRVAVRFGQAFKAPTFLDLYYPGFSNPDLKPEQSRTVELGLKHRTGGINLETQIYRSRISELIQRAQNIGEAEINGFELVLDKTWGDWLTGLRFSHTRTEDLDRGERLIRRPVNVLRLEASRSWNAWQFDADATYTGASKDRDFSAFPARTVTLSDFVLVNLQLRRDFGDRIRGFVKLANLMDEDYQTIFGYRNDGRSVSVGAALRY